MRLGVLSYVNTLPLTYGLECGGVPFPGRVVRGEPSVLNDLAARGQLDVTAVSSVEVARRRPPFEVLPGVCLKATGPVQSVRLFSRVPLAELAGGRVAITSASATSRILLQVLVDGLRPETVDGEPELTPEVPAALLIGDRALRDLPGSSYVYDLSEEWHRTTGKPMVFAMWLARRDFLQEAAQYLEASRRWGVEHRDRVLAEAERRTGLPRVRLEDYYRVLDYRLDEAGLAGLREFLMRAHLRGLLPEWCHKVAV
ncbi:MAG: menaquinone biosynthesis protein [Candidatus Eremiobacterota bacterium]